jgi:S1-C subfamily serine protease
LKYYDKIEVLERVYVKKLLLILLLVLSVSCTSCSFTRSVRDLFAESSPAVFMLEMEDGYCSSFHIGNGIVLTAAHCLREGTSALILNEDHKVLNPQVLLDDDEKTDIGILLVPEIKNFPFVVLGSAPSIGERLTTIGFPGYWRKKTIDIGYVLGLGLVDEVPIVFGSGNAFPGESGGPVLDERGFVIALVSGISPRGITFFTGQHLHRDVSILISVDAIKEKVNKVLTER